MAKVGIFYPKPHAGRAEQCKQITGNTTNFAIINIIIFNHNNMFVIKIN